MDNLLVEIFNVETLAFLSLLVDFLGVMNDLGDVCLAWKSDLLLLEVPDGSQGDVKLLGAAEESLIWGFQNTRVIQALCKAVEAHLLGDLHVLDQTLSLVGGESGGINVYLETVSINDIYLSGWQDIELYHAFDLVKLDIVPILELVALIIVHTDDTGVGLSGIDDDK